MLKVEFNFHITTCTIYFVFFSTAFQNSAKTLKTLQTKRKAVLYQEFSQWNDFLSWTANIFDVSVLNVPIMTDYPNRSNIFASKDISELLFFKVMELWWL